MKVLKLSPIAPLLAFLLTACETPTSPELPLLSLQAGLTRCHAVRGTITAQAFPGGAIGTIHGDLEGSIITVTEPDPVGSPELWPTGKQFRRVGHQTVEVTGGTIPSLAGSTLVWTIESRASWVSSTLLRVSNVLKLVEGATGKLASHGTLDAVTFATSFDYRGELCLSGSRPAFSGR